MKTRSLHASITATTNAAAQIDIVQSARVKAVQFSILCTDSAPAAGSLIRVELSSSSVMQSESNDAPSVLATCYAAIGFTTSGGGQVAQNFMFLCDYPIAAGERLYLNATEAGASTWIVNAVVHTT